MSIDIGDGGYNAHVSHYSMVLESMKFVACRAAMMLLGMLLLHSHVSGGTMFLLLMCQLMRRFIPCLMAAQMSESAAQKALFADGMKQRRCLIPADSISFIHDRMPVILPPAVAEDWLNPRYNGIEALKSAVLA